jgi:thiamine biosynthesis protein ThiS
MMNTTKTTVSVQLNGKPAEVEDGLSVRGLLESLDLHPGMVVVELNREILPRDSYDEFTIVREGDTPRARPLRRRRMRWRTPRRWSPRRVATPRS